jgi:hypothetical protein
VSEIPKEEYAAKLALYEKLVATDPRVTRKGASMPYTSRNGHMFSFLSKDGKVALRLPSGERESFIQKYKTELSIQYGAAMKEYVVVPDHLLRNTKELAAYFRSSYRYVSSLEPKPTTKKR